MKKFSLGDVVLDVALGLMHADHERKFAETDGPGGELAGDKERGSNNQ